MVKNIQITQKEKTVMQQIDWESNWVSFLRLLLFLIWEDFSNRVWTQYNYIIENERDLT